MSDASDATFAKACPLIRQTRLILADTHISHISAQSDLTCLDGLNLSTSQVADLLLRPPA
jgi:hypothetical protein